jgi:pSer/pThr/pTyr-binding forkhead associated (FHA) protein
MSAGPGEPIEIRVVDAAGRVLATVPLSQDGDYLVGRDAEVAEIALPDASVSRRHCLVRFAAGRLMVRDAGSTNGAKLGRLPLKTDWMAWDVGRPLHVGIYTLFPFDAAAGATTAGATPPTATPLPPEARPSVSVAFPATEFADDIVAVADLAATGRALVETDVVSIGGGPASFALVDVLRVRGLAADRIRVIAPEADPLARLVAMAGSLGLTAEDRLRAHGHATLDNVWGVPGYALRESLAALRALRLGDAVAPMAAAFLGSTLAAPLGPRLGDVRDGLAREAARIGWAEMRLPGRALAVRKTDDGRYAVAYRLPPDAAEGEARNRFVVARHLHLATGWPPLTLTPLVERFRRAHRGGNRVAALREPHEAVMAALARDGGTVAVLGSGFDAFVTLERLVRLRIVQRQLVIVRVGGPFLFGDDVWPRRAWTARPGDTPPAAPPPTVPERDDLLTTLEIGASDGWYRLIEGEATDVALNGETLTVTVAAADPPDQPLSFVADAVLDGREAEVDPLAQPLYGDLAAVYGLPRHPAAGRVRAGLVTDDDFALAALANGPGLAFASGLPVAGGGIGPVDSFLGARVAALAIADRLAGPLGLGAFGPRGALIGWRRRIAGRAP